MIGYRKYGHNEVDEPSFTQPKMYEKIREMKSLPHHYADKLVSEGVIKEKAYQKMIDQIVAHYDEEFKEAETFKPSMT